MKISKNLEKIKQKLLQKEDPNGRAYINYVRWRKINGLKKL